MEIKVNSTITPKPLKDQILYSYGYDKSAAGWPTNSVSFGNFLDKLKENLFTGIIASYALTRNKPDFSDAIIKRNMSFIIDISSVYRGHIISTDELKKQLDEIFIATKDYAYGYKMSEIFSPNEMPTINNISDIFYNFFKNEKFLFAEMRRLQHSRYNYQVAHDLGFISTIGTNFLRRDWGKWKEIDLQHLTEDTKPLEAKWVDKLDYFSKMKSGGYFLSPWAYLNDDVDTAYKGIDKFIRYALYFSKRNHKFNDIFNNLHWYIDGGKTKLSRYLFKNSGNETVKRIEEKIKQINYDFLNRK